MPDLNDLLRMRGCLKPTKIMVSREDGRVEEEQRADDGTFEVVFEDDGQADEGGKSSSEGFKPSARSRRTGRKWTGMVIDFKPDLQLACVSQGIYLSSQDVAQNLELLLRNGISHVVNVATGVRCFFPEKLVYLVLTAADVPTENLKRHFWKASEFMRKAVVGGKGKVLVHCNAGISRSTSIVLAYLMRYEGTGLDEALALVRRHRPIARPNEGFMRQLREFETELGLTLEDEAENGAKL